MIKDFSEVTSHLPKDVATLQQLLNLRKWEEAIHLLLMLSADMDNLIEWVVQETSARQLQFDVGFVKDMTQHIAVLPQFP